MLRIIPLMFFFTATGAAAAKPSRLFVVGDSTASEYGAQEAPREGWGQRLQSYLDPEGWEVRNHARSGHSSRSFIEEGALAPVEAAIGPGDVLLIQFGHDDQKDDDPSRLTESQREFARWLMRYVEMARRRQATPVLLTPLAHRSFRSGQAGDELRDTHGQYALAIRELARRENIALIDLAALSSNWLRALGAEASKDYYMQLPGRQADDTHLQQRGAHAVACMVVDGWKRIDPAVARHVVRDTDCGAQPTALTDRAAQPNPSLIVHERRIATAQPGPHGGAGQTTGYPFFADAPGLELAFRKRVLPAGAGIGLHQHDHDEIYYVISGSGVYTFDGRDHEVGPGNAMLVRTGSTHGIRQVGEEDLVLLITFTH